ncbi:Conserved_hypothetical protein [Hexamita inflata]|uniref:Uncharacterized protein n=2 Tax=Hexamita inflata TaxID=28002 RepID=A0AA86UWJ5_9EUKA|nr:Conserved hypothetical protein [Hexamita inflata]
MSNKIYSLEQFIFNVATIFLNPKEMYYFKIFVLANRSTNREKQLQVNNVFNHAHMRNYIQMSSLPEVELKLLDDEAKHKEDNQQNKDVDPDIMSLFNKGFIVRYAKYESSKIEFKTPLTFRATNFVMHFFDEFNILAPLKRNELDKTTLQKGSKYKCNYSTCARNRFSLAHESEILLQTKSKDLRFINCPVCKKQGAITKMEGQKIDKFQMQIVEILTELQQQSKYLKDACIEEEDYLERELRAMRARFNEKLNVQWAQEQIVQVDVDRRNIFNNKYMALQERENLKKERLILMCQGQNVNSVLKKIGPVFKAPRYYQSGLVGNQKPEWLEGVYKRAEMILKKE